MFEWLNATINLVKKLHPKVILEIGSGSGLILFNIIDDCSYYYATDFSKNAIDYTNNVINKFGYNHKVYTLTCAADQLPYHELKKAYDTVIINSVTQYFPNLDYLESIIIKAISNIKGSGQIFIGDIRDYRLLKCFHYSVRHYKSKKVTKEEVDYFSKRDKELLIAPEYFIHLKTINKFISHVEVMPKFGRANTEMNNYRYDVILYINSKEKDKLNINESKFVKVLEFENYFVLNRDKDYLCIRYPNKRIVKDYIEYNVLYKNELDINKDDYNDILSIDEILEMVENYNYKAKFLLDIHDPLYLNVVVYKSNNKQERNIYLNYLDRNRWSKSDLANNPLIASKLLENQLERELKLYLHSKLIEYMVPEYYIPLEKLPLTINGKLDRKALPEPELTKSDSYVAPSNELASLVCNIWSEALGLPEDKVGIYDDFFRLGGNSMLAIKLVSKLNKALSSAISVAAIFKNNTVDKLVHYLEHNTEDDVIIDKATVIAVERQSLSFAQERLWFIEKYEEGTNAYNIPMVFKLLDNTRVDILESSIRSIVTRHEILRTLIKEGAEGSGYQLVLDDKEYPLEILNVVVTDHMQLDLELKKEVNHVYDLTKEYPIKVCLYKLINNSTKNNTEYYLSIVIHHIAFDGWSTDILFRELQVYYKYHLAQSQGLETNLNLVDLDIQYKDFALWQRNYLSGDRLDKQLNYWKNKLSGYETLNLITDKPRPSQIDYSGKDLYFELDENISIALRELAKELKVSLYSLL
jgi:SAM-dependent methyltransferase/acyl carrier protein